MRGGAALAGCILVLVTVAGCASVATAFPLPRPGSSVAEARLGPDRVRILGDGTDVAAQLVGAVQTARRTVDAEIYEFDRPDLVAAMAAAPARGVRVRVVLDPTVTRDSATADRLRSAGAAVAYYPVGPMQIDHVKLLVVDGATAFFGGMNWGSRSYLNHDFEVQLRGQHAACLSSVFAADYARTGAASTPPTRGAPGCAWAGVRIVTTFPRADIQPEVLAAIGSAQRQIFVEMYAFTDPGAIAALLRAATRGVSVRVLLDPGQPLNRRTLVRLAAGEVVARFYRSSGEKLHAKAMVVDGHVLVVGSANWSRSGFTRNHELDAILDSPALAQAALWRMEADWRASSTG